MKYPDQFEESPFSSPNNDSHHPADSTSENINHLINRIRSRLRPDGPKVDYALLYAYADDGLPNEESRKKTQQLIYSWQSWYDAYWQIRAELEFKQTDLSLDESE